MRNARNAAVTSDTERRGGTTLEGEGKDTKVTEKVSTTHEKYERKCSGKGAKKRGRDNISQSFNMGGGGVGVFLGGGVGGGGGGGGGGGLGGGGGGGFFTGKKP